MSRRLTMAIALAVGVLLATLPSPAHADTRPVECSIGTEGLSPQLTGTAYYTKESGYKVRWTRIKYHLGGTRIGYWGDDNNVNVRISERDWEEIVFGGRVIYSPVSHTRWSYNSPDNRRWDTTYNVYPNILTTSRDRFGDVNDFVSLEAIFDHTLQSDPRCSDSVGPI